jgi:general secretion pathway protein H
VSASLQRGFSLIELLVTLLVVVIVTSLISLSVGSGGQDKQLESQLRNIAGVSEYALDEAQMRGVDYGLLLQQHMQKGETRVAYSWRELRLEGWRPPRQDAELFAGDVLPAGLEIDLELGDIPVTELADEAASEDTSPQILFYASGETTAGTMEIRDTGSGDLLWRLEWDLLGRFSLLLRGEPEDEEEDD